VISPRHFADQLRRSSLATSLLIGAAIAVCVLALRATGLLQSFELASYDWAIRHQTEGNEAVGRIVLIAITEPDIQAMGYPIPDGVLAGALEQIAEAGPRTIGLDLYRDLPIPPGHEDLERVLASHPEIITVTKVGGEGTARVSPPPVLKDTEQVGANDIVMDLGGIVRRGLLFLDDGPKTVYAFPLRLALLYLARDGILPQPGVPDPRDLRLGDVTFRPFESDDGAYVRADAAGYQILRDYKNARTGFPTFTLSALLSGQVEAATFRDKAVLVGIAAESVPDDFYTPYHSGFQTSAPIPGLVLHAQFLSQLLRAGLDKGAPLRTATEIQEALWTLFWGVLGGIVAIWAQSPWRFPVTTAGGLFVIASSAFLAFVNGWWIPIVLPGLAWVGSLTGVTVYTSREEKKQRTLIMQLFSPYVGPQIVEQLIKDPEKARRGSRQRREVTLLFCDVVGFVKFCEAHTVDEIVTQMNEYLGAMTEVVFHWGGTLIDFKGDEVYALWGAPLEQQDHVERAAKCAIHIRQRLAELNVKWAAEGKWQLQNGVGLNTGKVVFANMGAEGKRMKFEAVGDCVNLASRVEGLTRKFGVPILMTEITAERIKPTLLAEETADNRGRLSHVALRKVASVKVKGRDQPVVVYELRPLERHEPSRVEEPEIIETLVMTEK